MEVPAVVVIIGAVFLLVGVLGGGFEVKELRVPTVDKTIRYISVVIGLLFIVGGLTLHGLPGEGRKTRPVQPLPPSTQPSPMPPITPALAEPVQPPRQGADSVVADATHKYWEESLRIDRYRQDNLEELAIKYKNRQDNVSRAEALDQAASVFIESAERERALHIQNVDVELTQFFADGRNLLQRLAHIYQQQAHVLRAIASFGDQPSREMQMAWNRLTARLDDLNDVGEEYSREWESLRIRLTQRYNKNFSGH